MNSLYYHDICNKHVFFYVNKYVAVERHVKSTLQWYM